ncbi:MAG: NusG domain II-containing protein [Ruminococcus sp.]|nr:NusG domain II-containing protein [Ruminococcus sp.]
MKEKNIFRIRFTDIFLAVAIIILSILIFFYFIKRNGYAIGNEVIISVAGKEYGKYSLKEDTVINVETDDGYNHIEIKNGIVHMQEADCTDLYCVNQKGISKKGETIVCLPHKIVIEISEGNVDTEETEIDAVAK